MDDKKTEFAPFQRTKDADIQHLRATLSEKELMVEALNRLLEVVFLLDENRQRIFYNRALLNVLKKKDPSEIIGKRPGEVFSCVRLKEKNRVAEPRGSARSAERLTLFCLPRKEKDRLRNVVCVSKKRPREKLWN